MEILEGDPWSVEATVQGTRRYFVSISGKKQSLSVSCTCPYYEGYRETCKHIWATLLAAEEQGYLVGAGNSRPLQIEEADPAVFPDENDDVIQQPRAGHPSGSSWKQHLISIRGAMEEETPYQSTAWPPDREIIYVVDISATLSSQKLAVEVAYHEPKRDGEWGKLKSRKIRFSQISQLPNPADRQIMSILLGAKEDTNMWSIYHYSPYYESAPSSYLLSEPLWDVALPLVCATGRCRLRRSVNDPELKPVQWDDGEPWEFYLKLALDESGERYSVTGCLRRDEEEMALSTPLMLIKGGLVFYEDQVARLQDFGSFGWISLLREREFFSVPVKQADDFVTGLFGLPRWPRLELPEELRVEEISLKPKPQLMLKTGEQRSWSRDRLVGELSFEYDAEVISYRRPGRGVYQKERRRLIARDVGAELAAEKRLKELGFRRTSFTEDQELELPPNRLPTVVRALLNEGWHVEAQGKLYRMPGQFRIEVSSGVDWFELRGGAQFDETMVKLPELLRALKRGETTVRLDDGTFGMLPEEWVKKYGLLAGLGTVQEDHLRFTRQQIGLLDALLASEPQVTGDAVFERARAELQRFERIEPAHPPSGFVGQLRDYQRDGLGWLCFLQRFGFGGCLADDMGLGKTVQVLALLDSRRELRANGTPAKTDARMRPGPSLVVVPRSLVFHWKQEAARFTPKLRVLDHTGMARLKPGGHFDGYDLVITTYGTLRSDAVLFKDVSFDYCILDEAQTIKNARTLSAKAVRLLRADHRLALSGTPVENHLGELWSLFEFLNPGMLGNASVFRMGGVKGRNPDVKTRSLLARALRPFILRRTKGQVARELPQKTEQTLYCELEPRQRKLYDELRQYYRSRVLTHLERDGMNKVKFQVLEALLRLRQVACHPGLIDKTRVAEPSAKIVVLLSQIDQVLEEGHKALVFSQFTSFLAIVRDRLDRANIPYSYLDGRTRDRKARVECFQNDPNLKLFLISLKAGGLGLNLTAADYVYLLDPWWNPAVEAQAIDRTHRIGQTRQVFAYRLIAQDTVEEKVVELQKTKRDLADAIINADNSLIQNLSREDLELLLS
ncbi:MAG: DEAD/DEAH box helicase [Deltaproteobacteria bacterium]|nr:DEAD/DEAH box helicase [Deltaproteobacteria bacterium]